MACLAVQTASHNSFKIPVTLFTGSPGTVQSFSNSTPAVIPDGGTLNSTISVGSFPGPVGKVTVSLYLTHPQDQDMDITLEAPDGTIVELSTDNGATSANYGSDCATRTTFDDAAGTAIPTGMERAAAAERRVAELGSEAARTRLSVVPRDEPEARDYRRGNVRSRFRSAASRRRSSMRANPRTLSEPTPQRQ